MDTVATRLKEAREEANLTQEQLAEKVGCSQSLIGNLESGNQKSSARLPAIAQVLKVEAIWLAEGRGVRSPRAAGTESAVGIPHEDDYATIPQLHANGSCGDGYLNDHVEVRGSMAFKRDWIERMSIDPSRAGVIYARGDSMAPTINDGEVLLVDYRQSEPLSSRIYVLNLDGDLRVKRLFKRQSGWVISSDNQDRARYPDEPIDSPTGLKIVGRVVWRGGGL